MDIQFHGANCITFATKQARLVVDDNLADLGAKSIAKPGDVLLFTGLHAAPLKEGAKLVVDQPGEYEVANVSIYGIGTRSHLELEGDKSATMYKILAEDMSILVVGHVFPELSDAQLEAIGMVDIMFIPVGGNGFTLDGVGALKLIKKVEPKVIVPTHYESKKLQFPVPAQSLDQALKALAMEPKETLAKLRPRNEDLADPSMRLIVLEEA